MADEGAAAGAAGEGPDARRRLARLAVLMALGPLLYATFAWLRGAGALDVPASVQVAVPFLVVPLVWFEIDREPREWGGLDRSFALSAAAYAPFALVAAAAAPLAAWYYRPLGEAVTSSGLAPWWALETFFHVGSVDYFTKRVVQREAGHLWGERRALALQVVAWSAGHAVEWMWLRLILGDAGAAVYLVAAGVVTGVAYAKWRNVAGLMVGHFLVNVAAAAAAVGIYG